MNWEKIIPELEKRYGAESRKSSPFAVLISTVLSQRTRDEITEKVSERLLSEYGTPEQLANADQRNIKELIKPIGFYNMKAEKIVKLSKTLIEKYKGKVPDEFEELLKLPGVGPKTANCVLVYGLGRDALPVDVHVAVVSRRMGLTNENKPDKIQRDLERKIPREYWRKINRLFVELGKDTCRTRAPKCGECVIRKYCGFR